MKKKLKAYLLFGLTLAICASLAACGGSSGSKESGSASTSDSGGASVSGSTSDSGNEPAVKTLIVGSYNGISPPFFDFDENDNPTGFDYRVIAAVDELLPQYEFTYQFQDMVATLTGIDANTVDIGVNLFEWNEERAEKYLYTKTGYLDFNNYIIVAKDNNENWQSLADMVGKRVSVKQSSNAAYAVETYNKENPEAAVEIVYNNESDVQWAALLSGDVDATVGTELGINIYNAEHGDPVKITGAPLTESLAYIIVNKNEPEVQEAIDGALQQLLADGTIDKIKKETFDKYFDSLRAQ